jgi:hypothetical protein
LTAFLQVVRRGAAWLREAGKIERLRMVWHDEVSALDLVATLVPGRRRAGAAWKRRLEVLRCRARQAKVELEVHEDGQELRVRFSVRPD